MTTAIRAIEPDDAQILAELRSRYPFPRWEPEWPEDFYTAEGQRQRILTRLARAADGEAWSGVILADGEVIGQITITNILRRAWRKGELGYWIATSHQGQGHATRAVELTVALMAGELGLHRAEALTQMDNLPSQHVLRKCGFLPCGVYRSHIFTAGQWRDEIIWERLLDEPTGFRD
jgi:[ribosomal protein S5]-alanine N-acetyltransferase